MSADTRLVAKLKGDTAVSALVATRVYPNFRPAATLLPAIVYNATTNPVNHATGTTTTTTWHFTVESVAATGAESRALGDAVQTALSGWNDTTGAVWHLDTRNDDFGDPMPGTDTPEWFSDSQEYTVWST